MNFFDQEHTFSPHFSATHLFLRQREPAVVRFETKSRLNLNPGLLGPTTRTQPSVLMFSLRIFPRCFSRLAYLRRTANTERKASLPVAVPRYSLLFIRIMASASGNGEGEKPKHTNRLQHSKSPYLLQHKHNPVDW